MHSSEIQKLYFARVLSFTSLFIIMNSAISAIVLFSITIMSASIFISSLSEDFNPIVALIFIFSGIYVTYTASRHQLINSFKSWIHALNFYTVISIFIFLLFWYFPLSELGKLTTAGQLSEYQDANYYDYLAHLAYDKPLKDWLSISGATWLSQGVVLYLTSIYSLFGASQFNYLFVNILLGFTSLIFLEGIANSNRFSNYSQKFKKKSYVFISLFSPYILYYNITPGKEVLNNFTLFFLMFLIFQYLNKNKANIPLILVSFILLGFIRLHSLIIILAIITAYILAFKIRMLKSISFTLTIFFILFLFLLLVNFISSRIIGINIFEFMKLLSFDSTIDGSHAVIERYEAGVKSQIAILLISSNPILHFLLSPLRILVWLFSPFPFVVEPVFSFFSAIFSGDAYSRFRNLDIFRLIDSLILLFMLFKLIPKAIMRRRLYYGEATRFLFWIGLALSLFLTLRPVENARYRVLVEPIILTWSMLFLHECSVDQKNMMTRVSIQCGQGGNVAQSPGE